MKDLFGNEKIRSLGLYQPYANLMLHGKIESRWVRDGIKAPFPLGKYLIYSTKKFYSKREFDRMANDMAAEAWAKLNTDRIPPLMMNGLMICLGELVEVCPMPSTWLDSAYYWPPVSELVHREDGKLEIDGYILWALRFINVRRVDSIPFKGKQGVGILSEADKKKIKFI